MADQQNGADPFAKFWGDVMGRMGAANMASAFGGGSPEDAMKNMRRAFFDAWGEHAEEFMQSDAFLDMMRQSMENALAMRQHMNEFMKSALGETPLPSRDDVESVLMAVRGLENRVLKEVERLGSRMDDLEERLGESGGKSGGAKRSTKSTKKTSAEGAGK